MAMNLEEVRGMGDKSLLLIKKLNISTFSELLEYYPYRYEIVKLGDLTTCIKEKGTINVQVVSSPIVSFLGGRQNRLSMKCLYNGTFINVSIFNRGYLKSKIASGSYISITGRYDSFRNTFTANDISLEVLNKNEIIPIYHLVSGINNKMIRNIMKNAVSTRFDVDDYIPVIFKEKYNFLKKEEALKAVHYPEDIKTLKQARLRLIYEEFFLFAFKINYLKSLRNKKSGIKKEVTKEKLEEFINQLPFSLTSDQLEAADAIYKDMTSSTKMNRLIMGDVGSGKTVIALCGIAINTFAGYQSALMAPTEVLARQHYESLSKMAPVVRFGLIVGSMSLKEKKQVLLDLALGNIDCLIGTHAILNDKVEFKNLGLVITDEQHRFGVNQRNIIENKGLGVDVIYMSATPIPRTYALGLYGDMDLSIIKTKPNGRKPVITKYIEDKNLIEALKVCYENLKNGHQVYVVAPLIEASDNTLDDVKKLEEKFNLAFKRKYPVGILHGKMSKKDKNDIMQNFKSGELKILVSTTVIEVGVDVSNATVMMIYNANLFGLATLHQLRGRVGRSDLQSYCFLISKVDEPRLRVLESSNDGFYISEKDFEMRGEGDIFGERQSGDMHFKIADIKRDSKIWLQAFKDSKEYLDNFDNNSLYLKIMDGLQSN
mgnify:FL=1